MQSISFAANLAHLRHSSHIFADLTAALTCYVTLAITQRFLFTQIVQIMLFIDEAQIIGESAEANSPLKVLFNQVS